MTGQASFDAEVTRIMGRRQFLLGLGRAAGAALLLSSSAGCGRLRGGLERARLGQSAPVFNSVQRAVVAKVIDGFNPRDTELRRRLDREDPGYDPVAVYSAFAAAHGDDFVASMKILIDFLNVLPTLTRTFSTRYGLPARLQLRRFHADDANRYFLFLRDSSLRPLRTIFVGAKFIGTAPLYTNEKVVWSMMGYPGPWVTDSVTAVADRMRATSFDLAREMEDNIATLRRRVVPHHAARTAIASAARPGSDDLVLETDVVVVGSGAGGSFVAAELAARTRERILVLEKGDYIEPDEFLQRERLMMPRIFDTEFSVVDVLGRQIPTISTAVVSGKLVGGSATINHALAFEPPRAVIRDWGRHHGVVFGYEDLEPHLAAIRTLLRIGPVPESQIAGGNLALRRGAQALGLPHHGAPPRNAYQCIGCGYCDLGCRYNRKLTPLNVVLPIAARHGAQILANCRVDALRLETLPGDGRDGRTHRVTGVVAHLTDARGADRERVVIRARRVVLAAGPFGSARVLMRSGVPQLRRGRGAERAVGERFSTHATASVHGEFPEPLYPSAATPPMGYFVKRYEVADQATADPLHDHVRYALEGLVNHPLAHAQLMPYESAESHQAFMNRFNQTMTLALMFRDRPVGRITSRGFEYELAEDDQPAWLEALRTGARIMFAAGAARVFFNSVQPLILDDVREIDRALGMDLVRDQRLQITSGHPMGGCALGGDPRRDVVDSRGRSWDVDGLYVADGSILPTSLGVNPCYTIYALGRYIAHNIAEEIHA
jgi:choline dehydrogenase-like flavoprotein